MDVKLILCMATSLGRFENVNITAEAMKMMTRVRIHSVVLIGALEGSSIKSESAMRLITSVLMKSSIASIVLFFYFSRSDSRFNTKSQG